MSYYITVSPDGQDQIASNHGWSEFKKELQGKTAEKALNQFITTGSAKSGELLKAIVNLTRTHQLSRESKSIVAAMAQALEGQDGVAILMNGLVPTDTETGDEEVWVLRDDSGNTVTIGD